MGLTGLWRRSLIERPDGTSDSTTRVCWLQGIDLFVDLRQPENLPDFAHAGGLNHLSGSDCEQLARQEGFAGRLGFDGRHYEWARRIDFQPKSPTADAGSLTFRADVLIERGRDVDYVEHWHRDSAATNFPCGAAFLREGASGTDAVLVRVGGAFMFARGRAVTLPPHRTLRECIGAAPTVEVARSFVDCEISAGVIEAAGFRITASTLPFRRGCLLGQQVVRDTVTISDCSPDGAATHRVWNIVESEGDLAAL